jgi:HK97 family phage prohead protease
MKAIRFEIKEITEAGTFEGLLSPYGNVDGGNDVVEPGAYTKTLKERGSKVPMLWQHKSDCPIGELVLEDRKDGLWCKGQLLMELPEAQKAYVLIKAKIVKGLSIGFETIKDSIENGIRHLKEIRLWEGSVVTFPMNEMAMITSIKALRESKGDFIEELTEYQTLDAYYQMFAALRDAMSSCVWSDISKDEKIAMCNTILQQFTDAFASYFPDYLAVLASAYGIGADEEWSAKRELETKAVKAGARHSAETKSVLTGACEKLMGAHEDIQALLTEEAGEEKATSPAEAAPHQPEPAEPNHSAAVKSLLSSIKDELK